MVKSYLRYVQKDCFGVIASSPCEVLYYPGSDGRLVLASCLESVCIWNLRQGALVGRLVDEKNKAAVTAMTLYAPSSLLAVGYADGRVRIFNLKKRELTVVLNAHSTAVSALKFAPCGTVLASGSQDTDIVLWDVVSESGLFKLRGHKDEITDLLFLDVESSAFDPTTSVLGVSASASSTSGAEEGHARSHSTRLLISSSKDSLVKVWDIDQQHCVHTLTGHTGEVWSLDAMKRPSDTHALLVTGSSDKLLRVWKIAVSNPSAGTTAASSTSSSTTSSAATVAPQGVEFLGTIERPGGRKRVKAVRFDRSCANAHVLIVHGVDKVVDAYHVRTVEDRTRRQKRRFKRAAERDARLVKSGDRPGPAPAAYMPSDDLEPTVPIRCKSKVEAIAFHPKAYTPAVEGSKDDVDGEDGGDKVSKPAQVTLLIATHDNSLQVWDVALKSLTDAKNEGADLDGAGASSGSGSSAGLGATGGDLQAVRHVIDYPGHRGGVRVLALSSDDALLLSAAGNQIKLWNVSTRNCIRTLELAPSTASSTASDSVRLSTNVAGIADGEDAVADVIYSALFVPGNRQVLIGTKLGFIDLYDLASGALLCRERAHDGAAVWSLDLRADHRGFASGGGQEVWFWDLELVEIVAEDGTDEKKTAKKSTSASSSSVVSAGKRTTKQLAFGHVRTLKVSDDVLCVKHSPDGRYVAVGLLDGTARVFYEDSLAFFLSLYGHKQPVLSIDITSDSTLIVTGSADRTVKIWGMDFGDCHKSLRAHADSVMRVMCVPKTHFFFTVGKDKMVKYWDGDKFEEILELSGHHEEVWALTVANKGHFVVSAGNDRSLRLWVQTDQQVFLDEERERKMAESYDNSVRLAGDVASSSAIGAVVGGIAKVAGDQATDAWKGMKTTQEALEVSERIVQCLDICRTEQENWKRYHDLVKLRKEEESRVKAMAAGGSSIAKMLDQQAGKEEKKEIAQPTPHPFLMGGTLTQYVMRTLRSARLAEVNDALLTLPFDYAVRLLKFLTKMLEEGNEVELAIKCALLLLRVHGNQLTSTGSLVESLATLRRHSRLRLYAFKDIVGTNLAALQYLAKNIAETENEHIFGDPTESAVASSSSAATKRGKRKEYSTVPMRRKKAVKILRPR